MSESRIQQARCEECRITFYCLDTDVLKPCSKCGEPLERRPAPPVSGDRFDWPMLWERACVGLAARTDGEVSSIGIPAEAAVYLMRKACVPTNPPENE